MSDDTMSRTEAAQWLTDHGRPTLPTALATMAYQRTGPHITKEGVKPRYTEADLRAWLDSGPRQPPRRPNGHATNGGDDARQVDARLIETTTRDHRAKLDVSGDAAETIAAFLQVADRMLDGGGTFADGVAYARGLERLRKLIGG